MYMYIYIYICIYIYIYEILFVRLSYITKPVQEIARFVYCLIPDIVFYISIVSCLPRGIVVISFILPFQSCVTKLAARRLPQGPFPDPPQTLPGAPARDRVLFFVL